MYVFETGKPVFVVEDDTWYEKKEVIQGYDHLGPISGIRQIPHTNYKVEEVPFSFRLLARFRPDEIFTDREAAERHREEILKAALESKKKWEEINGL